MCRDTVESFPPESPTPIRFIFNSELELRRLIWLRNSLSVFFSKDLKKHFLH